MYNVPLDIQRWIFFARVVILPLTWGLRVIPIDFGSVVKVSYGVWTLHHYHNITITFRHIMMILYTCCNVALDLRMTPFDFGSMVKVNYRVWTLHRYRTITQLRVQCTFRHTTMILFARVVILPLTWGLRVIPIDFGSVVKVSYGVWTLHHYHNITITFRHIMMILYTCSNFALDLRVTPIDFGSIVKVRCGVWTLHRYHTITLLPLDIHW